MNFWFLIVFLILFAEVVFVFILQGKKKEGQWSFGETLLSHLILLFLIYMAIRTGF